MTASDAWRVIRANLPLIFTFLVASGIIGYAVNRVLERYASRYTAEGLITVQAPTTYDPLTKKYEAIGDFTNLDVERHTQAMLLMNDSLFTTVLKNPASSIRNTSWYHKFEFPIKEADGTVKNVLDIAAAKRSLRDAFVATPVEGSKIVRVNMTYQVPRDAREIVFAIVDQHLTVQRQLITDRQVEQSGVLGQLRTRISNHVKDLEDNLHQKAIELNIEGNVNGGGNNGATNTNSKFSTLDAELTHLLGAQLETSNHLMATQTNYDAVQQSLQNGVDPSYVQNTIDHDEAVKGYKEKIDDIDVNIQANFWNLPNSPDRKKLEALKTVYEEKLEQATARVRVTARNELATGLQTNLSVDQHSLSAITDRIKSLRDDLGQLSVAMSDYLSLSDELAKAKLDLESTNRQIESLNAQIQQTADGVQWSSLPTIPDTPSFPKLSATLPIALMLGLAISVGIAFLRELMDTTVRSPRDIARVGNLSLLGMVPHEDDDPQIAGVALPIVIYQAPTSMMAEGFRQVRTRLQHAASLDTTRSILVTSPSPGDGKSVVASNLAAGLALNGRRILLVDSNFRRPALAKYFAVDNTVGFSDVLGSMDKFDQAVHKTQVPNLDLMTTGPRPSNPTELLESQILLDFIERALEEYDHVVFDSGPMLLVSETAALAPRVDGVVTVVRARSNSRGLLTRLRDTLRQLKAEHLGIVLNAVRSQGGGYYGRNIRAYYEYQNGHSN